MTDDRPPDLLIDFVVPGPPHAKMRPRRAKHGKWYTPRLTVDTEAKVQAAARSAWAGRYMKPYLGRVAVEVIFWLPTRRKIDLDNLVKLVTDAIQPDVIADDAQIDAMGACKAYSSDDPRTEVWLYALHADGYWTQRPMVVETHAR